MTLSRLRGGRPRRQSRAERRQAEADTAEQGRKRQERVERDRLEQEQQDADDDEWDMLAEDAWTLTSQADELGMRLCAAASVSDEQFEQVRGEIEEFLEADPLSLSPYVYLGHLQGWLALYGLDIASGKAPLGLAQQQSALVPAWRASGQRGLADWWDREIRNAG